MNDLLPVSFYKKRTVTGLHIGKDQKRRREKKKICTFLCWPAVRVPVRTFPMKASGIVEIMKGAPFKVQREGYGKYMSRQEVGKVLPNC